MSNPRAIDRLLFVYAGPAPSSGSEAVGTRGAPVLALSGCALCRITHHGDDEKPELYTCHE